VAYLKDKIKGKDHTITRLVKGAIVDGRERSTSPSNYAPKLARIVDPLFFINKLKEDKLSFDG
jgi:hypothetical protein